MQECCLEMLSIQFNVSCLLKNTGQMRTCPCMPHHTFNLTSVWWWVSNNNVWVLFCQIHSVMFIYCFVQMETDLIAENNISFEVWLVHLSLCKPVTELYPSIYVIPMEFLNKMYMIWMKNWVSGSLIWSKTLMEPIFNPCSEFRWSPDGPVSQIHSSCLHVGAPGIFSNFLRSVQMLKRERVGWNGKLPHLFNPW